MNERKKKSVMRRLAGWALVALAALPVLWLLQTGSSDSTGSSSANAAEDWVIESFDAAYVIRADAVVEVTEDITVDFGSVAKHGIFRDIPVEYEYDETHNRVLGVNVQSVSLGSSPVQYTTSRKGSLFEIKIGDPNRTITGRQSYQIRYTATGALNSFADHDELFWNVTGSGWEVPINRSSATVRAPAISRTACFVGPAGSTSTCPVSTPSNGAATFNAGTALRPGSQLTIVVGMPKGAVVEPVRNLVRVKSDWEKTRDFLGLKPVPIFLAIVGAIGMVGMVVRHWWVAGRDRWYGDIQYLTGQRIETTKPLFSKDTVITEYEPPKIDGTRRLRPAEIGLLVDEDADTLDVSATIVDLAVRGYMRIVELEKTGLFGKTDYRLERLKPSDGSLLNYERVLLDSLFEGQETVEMSDLKNKFYTDLATVKEELYDQGTKQDKMFPRSPSSTRRLYAIAGLVIAVTGIVVLAFLGYGIGAGVLGVPVILAGLLLAALASAMPRRTGMGRELFRRSMGFKEYMVIAETDRQRFYEEANIFAEYLPYAIVFDCTEKWAKAFEGLEDTPSMSNATNWYVGSTAFHALAFSNNINSFSSSLSTTIASTPSSSGSSGFSGGSSGGGMGGGGGGSW